MRTPEEINDELNKLVEVNYYSESPDLVWAVKNLEETLAAGERDLLKKVALERLQAERSMVHVMLVSTWNLPEALPILVDMLNHEPATTQLSRMLMGVLQNYDDPSAYSAIERFLDSDQEGEALTHLARMDFIRTVDAFRRALKNPEMCNVCLHILQERKKKLGFPAFIGEFQKQVVPRSSFLRSCLKQMLTSKMGDYNPFTPSELDRMVALCDRSR